MRITTSALIVLLMASGCRSTRPTREITMAEPTPASTPPPRRPVLASASDSQITLFGELPDVPVYEFESRAAVSLRQHTFPSEGSDFDPSMNRDGSQVIFASSRHAMTPDIYIKDVDGIAVTQLTSDPASDVQPALSPDGRRVAFASDRSGNWDIWVVNIDGQQPIQVTSSPAHEVHPSWSPDGNQLVFCSMAERGGQWELWLASAEAGAIKKFVGYGLFPEWSPNSNTILYQRARRRGSRWFSLWTLTLINGEPRMPTEVLSSPEHAMILPTWSPDARSIAYCAVESVADLGHDTRSPLQQSDIWMVDIDGRGRVRMTDGVGANYAPAWSEQGRIYFTSDRAGDGRESLWSVIPLRAALPPQERQQSVSSNRDDATRADEMKEEDSRRRSNLASWPARDDGDQ